MFSFGWSSLNYCPKPLLPDLAEGTGNHSASDINRVMVGIELGIGLSKPAEYERRYYEKISSTQLETVH